MNKNFSNLLGGALTNKQAEESNIRNRIIVRDNLKALIPPLAKEEIEQLEINILKEGVRDPLVIWPVNNTYVLIDGHNRFSICLKHSLDFPFKEILFKDEDEAIDWMIQNQLGRRNLSNEQQSYLRGMRYNREKSQGKRNDLTSGHFVPKSDSGTTAEALAKEYNVSEKTIKRDAEFAKGIEIIGEENPELKKEILEGKSKLSKQEIRSISKQGTPTLKQKALRQKQTVPSAEEIAETAFAYIQTEDRLFDEVCESLGLVKSEIRPIEFFYKWKESKK